jgi:hypothetical protein
MAETFRSFAKVWPDPSTVDTELRPHYDQVLSSHTWGSDTGVTISIAKERIALMHRMYHELRLSGQQQRVLDKGILQILRGWNQHPVQMQAWQTVSGDYEEAFQRFYGSL